MAPTGRSGANDAEITGMESEDTIAGAETDALGEPIGLIEVVEVETLEPAAFSSEAYPDENAGWFRWWYVPAVVAPLAGATAAFVLLRRRRRDTAPVATYKAAMKQSRDWLDTVRNHKATQSAVNALQQGASTVRESAKNLPGTGLALRDRSGEIVGIVATSAAAQQAAQGVRGAVDSLTGFWNQNAPKAKQSAKEQTRRNLSGWFASGQALKVAQSQTSKANKALAKTKPVVKAAQSNATKNAARMAKQTNRTTKRAKKRVRGAVNRTQAFALSALVTATLTYARAWRQRLMEREMRETAGGRMVRD
jgi:hypothetical protein